jgi:hypothetical protein
MVGVPMQASWILHLM